MLPSQLPAKSPHKAARVSLAKLVLGRFGVGGLLPVLLSCPAAGDGLTCCQQQKPCGLGSLAEDEKLVGVQGSGETLGGGLGGAV